MLCAPQNSTCVVHLCESGREGLGCAHRRGFHGKLLQIHRMRRRAACFSVRAHLYASLYLLGLWAQAGRAGGGL